MIATIHPYRAVSGNGAVTYERWCNLAGYYQHCQRDEVAPDALAGLHGMLDRAELLDALREMVALVSDTADTLERESPGAAECGYWLTNQRAAFDRAKALVARND